MKDLFFYTKISLLLLFMANNIYSQNSILKLKGISTNKFIATNKLYPSEINTFLTFIKTTDAYYNLELFAFMSNQVIGSINMRLEEEFEYANGFNIFKDFNYFDLNLNYNIGKIGILFSINNLLSFNNSEFSIELELYGNNDVVNDFYFIHDQDFSIQTSITYTF